MRTHITHTGNTKRFCFIWFKLVVIHLPNGNLGDSVPNWNVISCNSRLYLFNCTLIYAIKLNWNLNIIHYTLFYKNQETFVEPGMFLSHWCFKIILIKNSVIKKIRETEWTETKHFHCSSLHEKRLNTIPYILVYGLHVPIYGSNLSEYGKIRERIQAFFTRWLLW